jgi:hypothetical protein
MWCDTQTRSNALCWNPMEAFNFTAANEDCCLYTFDMRKLSSARCVHKVRCVCVWRARARAHTSWRQLLLHMPPCIEALL